MSEMEVQEDKVAFAKLGEDLKNARKAMRITRATLAEMLDIDYRYLASIENYNKIPSLQLFHKMVVLCNLPVDKYFFNHDIEDDELQKLLNSVCSCPKKYRAAIKFLIDELKKVE